jgi:hypothetical protein
MAVKKEAVEEVVEGTQPKDGVPTPKPQSQKTDAAPGTIIKEYLQNGLRYKRVVTEDGGTVDMRV